MASVDDTGFLTKIIQEIVYSPLNLLLLTLITVLLYKVFKSRRSEEEHVEPEPELPKLRRDFTAEELKAYDGNGPDKRILIAVNGQVFDVTRGKRFYGPGKSCFSLLSTVPTQAPLLYFAGFARLTCLFRPKTHVNIVNMLLKVS